MKNVALAPARFLPVHVEEEAHQRLFVVRVAARVGFDDEPKALIGEAGAESDEKQKDQARSAPAGRAMETNTAGARNSQVDRVNGPSEITLLALQGIKRERITAQAHEKRGG